MQTAMEISVEPTAHPRARKFIVDRDVRTGAAVRFADRGECAHVPLAVALLTLDGVCEVHFADNVITITAGRGMGPVGSQGAACARRWHRGPRPGHARAR